MNTLALGRQTEAPQSFEAAPTTSLASIPDPRSEASPAYLAHLLAVQSLEPYDCRIVSRKSVGNTEETADGIFRKEVVTYSDGRIRNLTRGTPKSADICPVPISATDSLFTGEDGYNFEMIQTLVGLGFHVEWLHHQNRHIELPKGLRDIRRAGELLVHKSVERAGHHQNVLLNSLGVNADYDGSVNINFGDSRAADIGLGTEATARFYGRTVLFSDLMAICFGETPKKPRDIARLLTSPLVEGAALLGVAERSYTKRSDDHESWSARLRDTASTLDFHYKNLVNEASWIPELIFGKSGVLAQAAPTDQHGIRTALRDDSYSVGGSQLTSSLVHPHIHYAEIALPNRRWTRHVHLVEPEVQNARLERLGRLKAQIEAVGVDATQIDFDAVLGLAA